MVLKNKTVLFLGSSVTLGAASDNVSFADIMVEECGIKMIKEAVSSTMLADVNEQSYVSRLKKVDTSLSVDLFICQLSTNDAYYSVDLNKTREAIVFITEYVKKTFHCPVVFYSGTKYENDHYKKMIELLYEIQKKCDFYILDLYNDPEMLNISKEDYDRYMHDPVHPFFIGYKEWWTPKFINFCEAI